MDNQPVPNSVSEPTLTSAQVPVSETKSKFSLVVPVLLVILVLLLGSTAFLYYQNMQLKNMLANYQTPVVSPTPTATADPTANWKTYTNGKVSFKYPETWNLSNSNNVILLAPADVKAGNYPAVTFYVMDNPKNLTIQQYDEQTSKVGMDPGFYSAFVGNKEVIATERNLGGVVAYFMKDANCEPLVCDRLSLSYKSNIYIFNDVFQGIADNGIIDKSTEMRPIFDQILSTFKFTQ